MSSENTFNPLVRSLAYKSSSFPRIVDRMSRSHIWEGLNSRPYGDVELNRALTIALASVPAGALNALIRNPSCFYALLAAVKSNNPTLIEIVRDVANHSSSSVGNSLRLVSGAPNVKIITSNGAENHETHVNNVQKAMWVIRARAPLAAANVARYVSEIQFYDDPDIEVFSSASNNQWHRRVQIVNYRQAEISICRLADALVHESIHSFLYSLELELPLVAGENLNDCIRSPWSGRLLKIHSYLHACFVWYSLALFWSRPGPTMAGEENEPDILSARARRGFEAGSITEALAPYGSLLAAGLIDCIASLDVSSARRA